LILSAKVDIPADYYIDYLFFTFVVSLVRMRLFVLSRYLSVSAVVLCTAACSIEQNTITSNFFHNTAAHYNGYFYAREKIRDVEKVILKSLDDDHNQVLLLFPQIDTTLAKSYAKETEEAIKMASISIQRHPNSKWVYQNYLMVGMARLYDADFPEAIQTFKYVNTKSRDANLRHEALLRLARTFTEYQEYAKTEETLLFLSKEKLNRHNTKRYFLEKAYYHQVRNDYDNMVRNLTLADSLLSRHDRKSRIYFIVGQVYQQLGFGAEAYNYYQKCLATNPEYEIEFYARLNMAQVARLDDSRDVRQVRKQFNKLLADTKNAEFKDKIYFELGEFERKQNHQPEAIANYKLATKAGKNKRIQSNAYLRIGELYFDSLRKYSLAKAYYDSAMSGLPKETKNYDQIQKRQQVLGDFVKYTETIQLQDSLLRMAAMDSTALQHLLDSMQQAKEKQQALAAGKKKKRAATASGNSSANNTFLATATTGTSDWYFGNPSAVALGQSEFQRIWGNIALEDNWRRSGKAAVGGVTSNPVASTDATEAAPAANDKTLETKNLASALFAQLPKSEKQKKEALEKIETAYFKLGDLFFLQLNERTNAAESYRQVINRFPGSEYEPEVLYKLYLIEKERDPARAAQYAQQLQQAHPQSMFTRVMLNPNYLLETSAVAEKQKNIYAEAYAYFQSGNLRSAQEKVNEALALGETGFVPQLELLKILITGKTEDVTRYQFELAEFIKKYPDGSVTPYANTLLAASKNLLDKIEKARGIRFTQHNEGTYYFIVAHKVADKLTDRLTAALELFNNQRFKDKKLKTSNLVFDETHALTMVSELPSRALAEEYFAQFKATDAQRVTLSSYKFDIFVITKDNFQTFYRTKALDEYLTFFDRTYQKQNQ